MRSRAAGFTLALCVAAGGAAAGCTAAAEPAPPRPVRTGIQVLLDDSLHLVRGKRVGLITNHTGVAKVDGAVRSSIDLLHDHPDVNLVALFGPEHGLRGEAEAGEKVDDGVDDRTGLPVFSLYGSTRAPSPEMLEGVEVLLFDIQDIGTRYYTYVWTMALSMEAALETGIDFVVLDRPNPLGAPAQGSVLDPEFASFVGLFPVPMRHGLTPGEMARWIARRDGDDVAGAGMPGGALADTARETPSGQLHIVPVDNWTPRDRWPESLPWLAPSPNMPDLVSALHYPGTCLFEGTNLSVGRGTDRPFQWVGAPFLDGAELAERLNGRGLPGVRFEAVRFTPVAAGDGKFSDVEVEGVQFVATDESIYDPTAAAAWTLMEARLMAGAAWEWRTSHFDRLAGTDALREIIQAGDADALVLLLDEWRRAAAAFANDAQAIRIYPRGE